MIEKALSLKQPWAWLVVHGPKDIENRSWNTKLRGRFAIHASQTHWRDEYEKAAVVCRELGADLPPYGDPVYQCGGIIGTAVVVDVLSRWCSARPWKFEGQYGFVLEERRPVEFVPCPGALNFWRLPGGIVMAP